MDEDDDTGRERGSDNQERADRILDAAARLIMRFGFDKTTVGEIADEAGVSKGAIYLHWKSKDELFEALIYRETQDYTQEWLRRLEADPDGGKLLNMYIHSLNILTTRPMLQALVVRDKRVLGDFLRRNNPTYFSERYLLGAEFIGMMQEAGNIRRELDAQAVAYILNCLRYGILSISEVIPPEQSPPIEQVILTLADLMAHALAPEGGEDSAAGKRILEQMQEKMKAMLQPGRDRVQGL